MGRVGRAPTTGDTRMMAIQADLREVTYALSDALDRVGVDDSGHGKRVGIMAAECGKARGLPEPEVSFLFDVGILHDLGVSSTKVHRSLVDEFGWQGAQHHCELDHSLLKSYSPLASLALPVKYHHTSWERLLEMGVDPAVARQANLVHLVDRVDAMTTPYHANNTELIHAE